MRRLALSIFVCLALAVPARADDGIPGPPEEHDMTVRVKVRVGETVRVALTHVASVGTCDDPEVVKVEDGGDALNFRGMKEGVTKCGFWDAAVQSHHTVVEVTVEPKKP